MWHTVFGKGKTEEIWSMAEIYLVEDVISRLFFLRENKGLNISLDICPE